MHSLPRFCRFLIRAASCVVPSPRRKDWRDRREFEAWNWWMLLAERRELTPRSRHEIYLHCLRAFADALWVRLDREETGARVHRFLRGPYSIPLAALLLLAVIAAVSGGFAGLRAFWHPVQYPRAQELVRIQYQPSVGHPHSVPMWAFASWREHATSLNGMAAFRLSWRPWQRNGTVRSDMLVARITPNLFSLIGVQPRLGRLIRETDQGGVAVLSYDCWRWRFHKDPAVIGRTLHIGDQPATIIGVLPERFAVLPASVVVPFRLQSVTERQLMGAIARVKPGVSRDAAERELFGLAKAYIPNPFHPRLAPLEQRSFSAVMGYLLCLIFGVVIGLAMVQMRRASFPPVPHASKASRIRYWTFFAVKTTLVILVLLLAWVEGSQAIRTRYEDGPLPELVAYVLAGIAFFCTSGYIIYWSFCDQRRRCPVCLDLLTLPVRIGSWANPLLEPVSTEMVCERGHGALCLQETQSSASDKDRWTALDSSWKELFTK